MSGDTLYHTQTIPYSVLTMLYILENPPSTIVMLKFATSLVYLGCASLIIIYVNRASLP
jgi:hypothetical protein